MDEDSSVVKKTETTINDLVDLWHRRPKLCVLVAVVIAFPTFIAVIAIPSLNSSLTKAEYERDKAQLQLAPFLAAANRGFPDSPAEKRLELMLAAFGKAIADAQDAARQVSQLNRTAVLSLFLNGQEIVSDQCIAVHKTNNHYKLRFLVRNSGKGTAHEAQLTFTYPSIITNIDMPPDWNSAPSQSWISGAIVDDPTRKAISTSDQKQIHPDSGFLCSPLIVRSDDNIASTQLVVVVASARDTEQRKHVFKIVFLSDMHRQQ